MSTVLQDIAVDVAADLASSAVKSCATFLVKKCKSFMEEHETVEEAPPPEFLTSDMEAVFASIAATFEPFPEPDLQAHAAECGEDFLRSLQSRGDDRVCAWCAATMFDDAQRKEVLLNTLASPRPSGWTLQQTLNLVSTRTRVKSYGVDFDVYFNVDGESQALSLLLVFAQEGEYMAVQNIYWEYPDTTTWR
jgi:hypothetical protein